MMNEGHFISLRDYAAEQSSLLRQLLDAQNKTNEMLSQLVAKPEEKPRVTVLRDMGNIGPISVETGEPVLPKATPKKGK